MHLRGMSEGPQGPEVGGIKGRSAGRKNYPQILKVDL